MSPTRMIYWLLRAAFAILLKIFFRFKVEGRENIPRRGNFILVANHTSYLDPVVIAAAIPRKIYWITARVIYNSPWLRWIMTIAESLPTGSAAQKAAALLEQNRVVGMFPEGVRTPDGKLREFRRGAAVLAIKTGRPVLPCAVIGAYEALPHGAVFPKFVSITVRIGKPRILLKEYEDEIDEMILQRGTFKIRGAVREMMYGR